MGATELPGLDQARAAVPVQAIPMLSLAGV